MNSFITALQFLTILPLRTKKVPETINFSWVMACFPVAGLVIGLILAGMYILLSSFFPELVSSILLVILLTVLTGGLHADGLADTFDGIGSRKDPEKALEIMRDSRIGTMGTLSIISVFLLKVALLTYIPAPGKLSLLVAMPVLSRWSMLLPMRFFPYARAEGKAKSFFEGMNSKVLLIATIVTVLPAIGLLELTGLHLLLLVTASTMLASFFFSRRLGGITGDVLGALNEINEIVILFAFFILSSGETL